MAGEYYRYLARDVKPARKKELTPEEKRRNWWAYHKWYVIIGVIALVFALDFVWDVSQNARNKPDYLITYVGRTALPEDTELALEDALATLGEDLNGSGSVRVDVMCFRLGEETSPDMGQGASMQLLIQAETAECVIYLLEEPERFLDSYPILVRADGSSPAEPSDSGVPMWYRWGDCPAAAGLELGEISLNPEDPAVPNQQILENVFIARRGIWGEATDLTDGAVALWNKLIHGAA